MKEDVLVNWNVKNNAALRIALFFELTKINFSKFEQEILKRGFLFSNVNKIRDVITKSLFLFVDDLFTPIVITSLLENEQDLCGKSSQEKYASFFITKDLYWQENALKIKKSHPFLIKNLKKLAVKEMRSYLFFLKVLEKDKEQIISNFKISSSLVKNLTLNLSDHHNFMGTAIEVTFENGQKVVYKPRNASSDQIFNKLIKVLNSSKNFYIKTPKVLNFCKYHWVKSINYIPCKTDEDLHIFYKNVGILMGILDMLNYSDGHDENFIVSNKNFILVDTETLFTNLSYFVSRTKNYFDLEFTGMIPPNQAKFWIPIIALYHGCRQNEICQLDVNDIVIEKDIPCISINDDGDDKSVKNSSSKRIIPIHPKLVDMGFLSYVDYQRKNKHKKLFPELTRTKQNGYARVIQGWFGRYLDKIGIRDKKKVFHSFRHTFETKAVEIKMPIEYQNAICGWTDRGVGQRIYGRKKNINVTFEEISKINFSIKKELNELKKKFMDSYIMK